MSARSGGRGLVGLTCSSHLRPESRRIGPSAVSSRWRGADRADSAYLHKDDPAMGSSRTDRRPQRHRRAGGRAREPSAGRPTDTRHRRQLDTGNGVGCAPPCRTEPASGTPTRSSATPRPRLPAARCLSDILPLRKRRPLLPVSGRRDESVPDHHHRPRTTDWTLHDRMRNTPRPSRLSSRPQSHTGGPKGPSSSPEYRPQRRCAGWSTSSPVLDPCRRHSRAQGAGRRRRQQGAWSRPNIGTTASAQTCRISASVLRLCWHTRTSRTVCVSSENP